MHVEGILTTRRTTGNNNIIVITTTTPTTIFSRRRSLFSSQWEYKLQEGAQRIGLGRLLLGGDRKKGECTD
jgi:hypothetical protein